MILILATVDTSNFHFAALADLRENVETLLLQGWHKHCEEWPDADPTMMVDLINDGDVNFAHVNTDGTMLRDGELLIGWT